jgi:quercetin dioxygenase-like cupin family protein
MTKKERVFVRGVTSETYGLSQHRRHQLEHDRVRGEAVVTDDGTIGHEGAGDEAEVWWKIGPGDDEFLTQTIQVHFVEIDPHGANQGHGHQNEAAFYILEGAGYEIHDGLRYEWKKDDFVFVHTDSVHRHYNPNDEKAVALVVKAKSTWMFMGLIQQGGGGPISRPDEFGPREEWGRIWTPGVVGRNKVVTTENTTWETTPLGRVRALAGPTRPEDRIFSLDAYELEVPAGSRSGKYWKMADEAFFALEGAGHVLMWEVEAELDDRYYARVALEPRRYDFGKADTVYVPQNHVVQFFAADDQPVRLFQAQNRLFRSLGYDNVHFFENAPEFEESTTLAGAAV